MRILADAQVRKLVFVGNVYYKAAEAIEKLLFILRGMLMADTTSGELARALLHS